MKLFVETTVTEKEHWYSQQQPEHYDALILEGHRKQHSLSIAQTIEPLLEMKPLEDRNEKTFRTELFVLSVPQMAQVMDEIRELTNHYPSRAIAEQIYNRIFEILTKQDLEERK